MNGRHIIGMQNLCNKKTRNSWRRFKIHWKKESKKCRAWIFRSRDRAAEADEIKKRRRQKSLKLARVWSELRINGLLGAMMTWKDRENIWGEKWGSVMGVDDSGPQTFKDKLEEENHWKCRPSNFFGRQQEEMEAACKGREDDLVKMLLGDPVFFECVTELSHETDRVMPRCDKMVDIVRIGVWDWLGWTNNDVKDEIKKILGMGKCETLMQRELLDNAHRKNTWVRPEGTHWDTVWCHDCGRAQELVTERRPCFGAPNAPQM